MAQFSSTSNVPSKAGHSKVEISRLGDLQNKICFSDPKVDSIVNSIVGVLAAAVYRGNADIVDTLRFLLGASLEISMQYNPIPTASLIAFSVGDVVECKFGTHVDGEISGMHVHSIVCDIQDDGTAYLLPITKQILDGDGRKYLLMRAHQDVNYYDTKFTGGTVLLRMGKYVRPERIRIIVGKTTPDFFQHLLSIFHDSMDFSCNLPSKEGTSSSFFNDGNNTVEEQPLSHAENANSGVASAVRPAPEGVSQDEVQKAHVKKVPFEIYMRNLLEPVLDQINDPSFSIEDKVSFLISELKFEDRLAVVHDAFVLSCEVPRVTWPSILAALSKIHKTADKETLKEVINLSYEQWLSHHPEISESYNNTSIMTMFKIFSQKMK